MASATWKSATEEPKLPGVQDTSSIPAKVTPRFWLAPAVGTKETGTLPGAWQQDPSLTEMLKGSVFWDFPEDRKQQQQQ